MPYISCPYCAKDNQAPPTSEAGNLFLCPFCRNQYRFTGTAAVAVPQVPRVLEPPPGSVADMATRGMTDNQRYMFLMEWDRSAKDATFGLVLALLFGGTGAHRFYLGETWVGVVYLLFCWTLIPSFCGVFEAFVMPSRVHAFNKQKAQEISIRIRSTIT